MKNKNRDVSQKYINYANTEIFAFITTSPDQLI